MKKTVVFILLVVTFFSCRNRSENTNDYSKISSKVDIHQEHAGKKLLEQQCYICHRPTASHDARIAPPMIAIKAHYINKGTSKKVFTDALIKFLNNPTVENARMRGAVRRFGVMPKQNFKEEDIKLIAEYLYDYEIEEPDWFKAHWQEKQGKPYINKGKKLAYIETEKTPSDIGLEYALGTKKVLGKNLMETIQKQGTLEALQFCNEKAYALTDSMAAHYNATIKRVSDKPRNPNNRANSKELSIIETYKKIITNNEDVTPIIEPLDGQTQFYYPIITNSMCMQCHGTPKTQIRTDVLTKLSELYPKDQAIGYDDNTLRGIWSINFKRSN